MREYELGWYYCKSHNIFHNVLLHHTALQYFFNSIALMCYKVDSYNWDSSYVIDIVVLIKYASKLVCQIANTERPHKNTGVQNSNIVWEKTNLDYKLKPREIY